MGVKNNGWVDIIAVIGMFNLVGIYLWGQLPGWFQVVFGLEFVTLIIFLRFRKEKEDEKNNM